MWTFPTVRPTSMNKLQKGYTHTDSEVTQTHTHTVGSVNRKTLTCNFYLVSIQSGDSVKRQPKSQCLSALVTPIFREVGSSCHTFKRCKIPNCFALAKMVYHPCSGTDVTVLCCVVASTAWLTQCHVFFVCPVEGEAAGEWRWCRGH